MTGSAAEEALRAKAEAMMRQRWPAGRIVHELQCGQMQHRLDLACITTDRLVLAEIKSERDVLKRAPAQLHKAVAVADEVWLCVAAKHGEAVLAQASQWGNPFEWDEYRDRGLLYRCVKLYVDRDKNAPHLAPCWTVTQDHFDPSPDPYQRFDLLWAIEMRAALGEHFGGATLPGSDTRLDRGKMTRIAVEHLSGREIRRAVCRQLRSRHFPRADAPVPVVADAA